LTQRKVTCTLSAMETDPVDAQSALDTAATAERRSAEIATPPLWYDLWFGVTCAVIPVEAAIGTAIAAAPILLIVECLSFGLLLATYRRVTGVWPRQLFMFTHVRFVLLLVTLVVLLVGAAAANTQLAWSYGLGWWLVPVAVATAVLATLLSRTGNAMYAHVLGAR
jgi:hypothetical protein